VSEQQSATREPAETGDEVAGDEHVDRADRLQERLAVPVLIAALASVPAVFLTLFDGTANTVGSVVNALSGAVLVAEAVVLFAVSEHRLRWLRQNLWLVALAVVMVPAVLFAVGPVQLLRLLRVAGALRIIRVGRIFKAGRIVRQRAGLDEVWQRVVGFGVTLLVAGFVAVVLADPTSESRQLLEGVAEFAGPVGIVVAGGLLAAATLIVLLARREEPSASEGDADR
jgi:CsoR family transcriptional regulator, copper-sensing transcriptional repressor